MSGVVSSQQVAAVARGTDEIRTRLRRHVVGILCVTSAALTVGLAGLLPPTVPWWAPAASFIAASVLISIVYSTKAGGSRLDIHVRAAAQAVSLTVVTYLTGWGFALPFVHLFGITDNINESGSDAGRISLLWAIATTAAAQLGVARDLVPVEAISISSSHLVAGITIVLLALVTKRLQSAAVEREQALAELDRSERRFRTLVEAATDVILLLDRRLTITYASPAMERVVGNTGRIVGTPLMHLVHPDDAGRVARTLRSFSAGRVQPTLTQFRITRADGSVAQMESSQRDLLDDPAVGALVVNIRDVTDRVQLEEELEHGREHDAQTGLLNRAGLLSRLEVTLHDHVGRGVGMLALGVDGLDAVAAAGGRESVDEVVRSVARDVAASVRGGNVLARTGDGRLGIVVTDVTGLASLYTIAERLREAVARTVDIAGATMGVDSSIGLAQAAPHASARDVLRAADLALAAARESGSGITRFDESLRSSLRERLAAEQDLKRAIASSSEFVAHYQPLIALDDRVEQPGGPSVVGVEALVRWQHPVRGLLGPGRFVPLAEETGLVVDIGWWVLDEALGQLVDWDVLLGTGAIGYVSVNVSMLQFATGELVRRVERSLERHGLAPHRLVLELTETALAEDPARTVPQLSMLAALGVHLAVDDFGTGYSSMAYLQQFPVDVLKIDRAFVSSASPSHRPELLASLRQLAEALGLRTVAEGIETEQELAAVRDLRFDVGQGYLFGRPVDAAAITSRIRQQRMLVGGAIEQDGCPASTGVGSGHRPTTPDERRRSPEGAA